MSVRSFIIALTIIVAILDGGVAILSMRKKNAAGKTLALTCLAALIVNFSYLFSVLSDQYRMVSVCSSLFFAGMDMLLNALLMFTIQFCRFDSKSRLRKLTAVAHVFMGFELVWLAINPIKVIGIDYMYQPDAFPVYLLEWHTLGIIHFVYNYVLIGIIMALLLYRATTLPGAYNRPYILTLLCLAIMGGVNAIFDFMPNRGIFTTIDISIYGYGLAAVIVYSCCFIYAKAGMESYFRNVIVNKVDQGVLLFDYTDHLVLSNQQAAKLMPEMALDESLTLNHFLQNLETAELPKEMPQELPDGKMTFQYYLTDHAGAQAIRCDLQNMQDKLGRKTGTLLVFTKQEGQTDLLTGFVTYDAFLQYGLMHPETFEPLFTLAFFDIDSLSDINRNEGRQAGDKLIRRLAQEVRSAYPDKCYFVRGREAAIVVLCPGMIESQVLDITETIRQKLDVSFQCGVSESKAGETDVEAAARRAMESLRNKKMMEDTSRHAPMLASLMQALKESDEDTEAHVLRTGIMGQKLGQRLGLSDLELSQLALLSKIHDIGKIGIPLEILNKPGRLTQNEWKVLQTHVEKGYQIAMSSPYLVNIAPMVRYHHEKWDGTGYPDGLKGKDIPLLARIIAVVDSYDAMISRRAYKASRPKSEVLTEIDACAGTHFDPRVAKAFTKMVREEGEMMIPPESLEKPKSPVRKAPPVVKLAGNLITPIRFARYYLDNTETIVRANKAFFEMTGYPEWEVRERRLNQMKLIPEYEREAYGKMVKTALAGDDMVYFRHSIICRDGHRLEVLCLGRRYYDPSIMDVQSEIVIVPVSSLMHWSLSLDEEKAGNGPAGRA
ncbi:MAG: GTP cyclohydrolase IIa [Lachnospiraceae bacterium]|nr:GTP cyclohydrolase IIa [Lachnospiraceae bacterium]